MLVGDRTAAFANTKDKEQSKLVAISTGVQRKKKEL